LRSRVDLEVQPIGRKPRGKRGSKNARRFDLRSELYRITGIDWAQIHGIYVPTAQTVIAETGADLRAFSSEKQFASLAGIMSHQVVNRASPAFRNSASTLLRSKKLPGRTVPPPADLVRSALPRTADPRRHQKAQKLGLQLVMPSAA